jgi:hypothetical protein
VRYTGFVVDWALVNGVLQTALAFAALAIAIAQWLDRKKSLTSMTGGSLV